MKVNEAFAVVIIMEVVFGLLLIGFLIYLLK